MQTKLGSHCDLHSRDECRGVQVTSLRHVPVVAAVRVTPVAGHANAALEHSGDQDTGHLCNKPGAERRHETWRAAAARSSPWRCCSPSRWTRPRPGGGGCWCGGRSRCRPPTPRSPAAAASRGRGGWSGGGWCRPRPHRSCSPPRRRCRNTNPSPSTRQWRPNLTPSRDVSSWNILITL